MLRMRITSAVIAGLVVLGAVLWGPSPWHWLVYIGTLIGMSEYSKMLGLGYFDPLTWWALLSLSAELWWFPTHLALMVPVLVGVALVWPVLSRNRITVSQSSAIAVGVLYLGYGGGSLALVRAFPHGVAWVFYLLISIWMTDTVAFFAGKSLGGRKLWPSISPSKTISGAVAGIVGGAVGASVWGHFMIPGVSWYIHCLMGAVISMAGQMGDLVESAYKRSAGVKDSGNIMPGHGGMLDRVDSLFLAAPVLYFLVVHGVLTWSL